MPLIDVLCIGMESSGKLWAGTNNGLFSFNGSTWEAFYQTEGQLPSSRVNDIYVQSNNFIWFGTNGGLAKLNNGQWTVYTYLNSSLHNVAISVITPDDDGNLWIGTAGIFSMLRKGIYKFDGTDFINYNIDNSPLADDRVTAIYIDDNDNKWIACAYNGLHVFNENGVNLSVKPILIEAEKTLVYPNPASDIVFVESDENVIILSVELLSVTGQIISRIEKVNNNAQFNLNGLPNGLYLLKVKTSNGIETHKIIKE
jgi:ligand-binding sensor domain-containing protein